MAEMCDHHDTFTPHSATRTPTQCCKQGQASSLVPRPPHSLQTAPQAHQGKPRTLSNRNHFFRSILSHCSLN